MLKNVILSLTSDLEMTEGDFVWEFFIVLVAGLLTSSVISAIAKKRFWIGELCSGIYFFVMSAVYSSRASDSLLWKKEFSTLSTASFWMGVLSMGMALLFYLAEKIDAQKKNAASTVYRTCPHCGAAQHSNLAQVCAVCGKNLNPLRSGTPGSATEERIPAWKRVEMMEKAKAMAGGGTESVVYCTKCASQNEAGNTHCTHCGAPLQENGQNAESACLFCGASMPKGQTFCGSCGRRQD